MYSSKTKNDFARPVQDHFEKDPDQILFFKKDPDQDPFRITSEKRIWIRSFSDHLWKKDPDQILFGSPPKKGSGSRSFSDHLWKKDLDHGSRIKGSVSGSWSVIRIKILEQVCYLIYFIKIIGEAECWQRHEVLWLLYFSSGYIGLLTL